MRSDRAATKATPWHRAVLVVRADRATKLTEFRTSGMSFAKERVSNPLRALHPLSAALPPPGGPLRVRNRPLHGGGRPARLCRPARRPGAPLGPRAHCSVASTRRVACIGRAHDRRLVARRADAAA